MLEPHRLRIFRAVVASGSVQAAADNLGMTPSAVSQHLSALARETGLTLFERSGRGIVPTEAAIRLASESDEVMSQWARLESVVTDLRDGRSGRLAIGYFASAGATWMPALAARLRQEFPDLVLELVLTEVDQRGVPRDIELVIDPPETPVPAGYRRTDLSIDPFVAILPADHPLAGRESLPLAELRSETWVSSDFPRSVGHRLVVAACAAAGFRPRFAVQAQDHFTAISFVAAGLGISVLPGLAAAIVPDIVRRVPLEQPAPVRHLAALRRDLGSRHPAADRAIEILKELIADAGTALPPLSLH